MRIDLHPEDLLELAARGTATDADWARLNQHMAECAVCRVERALAVQAALDAAPPRDEKLAVARLKRAVAARLVSPSAARPKRKGAFVAAALAAGALASVAAAATLVAVLRDAAPPAIATPLTSGAPVLTSPPPMKAGSSRGVATSDGEVAQQRTQPSTKTAPQGVRPAPLAALEPTSASELFSHANRARREGRMTEAVQLYRALQEHFSGSSEELVSRVALGRLLLDRLGDSRGALVQFNSYLASPGGGALREEAMVGRALSLGRMGRSAEERAAWTALLEAWPTSAHRKRAEARLIELGGADAADAVRPRAGTRDGGSERAP